MELDRGSTTPSLDLEGHRAFAAVASRLTGRKRAVEIGRYELDEQLGEGGFGAVYRAHDPKLDRDVALKVVKHVAAAATVKGEERLASEARALAQLGHRNVVQVFDVGRDVVEGAPHLYIVMELLEGVTLRRWLEKERSVDEILAAFRQAGAGLAAAHGVGVVHRDFKPANVMFAGDGRVVVLDFGLAYGEGTSTGASTDSGEVSSSESGPSSRPTKLTQTGLVMGTPLYMAPEQHDARTVDERTDQFGFCVALWEALQGEPPFRGRTLSKLAQQKRAGPPSRPSSMPRFVYDVLARGLSSRPDRRFASMADLLAGLAPRPRSAGRRWALGLAAVGALGGSAALNFEARPDVCGLEPTWAEAYDGVAEAATPPRESPFWGLQSQVSARLERFDRRWHETAAVVCEAEQSPVVTRAVAGACLERAATTFESALRTADERPPLSELEYDVLSLAVPTRCLGADAADLYVLDAAQRTAGLGVLESLGDDPDEPTLERLASDADALDNPWLSARVRQRQGVLAFKHGDPKKGAEHFDQAVWHAEHGEDHLLAAEMLPGAVSGLVDGGVRPEEIQTWVERGHQILEVAGDPPSATARLLVIEALVDYGRGDSPAAQEKLDRSLELVDHDPPPGAASRFALARLLSLGFRIQDLPPRETERRGEEILALVEPFDPWYPNIANSVLHIMSEAALARGDVETALVRRIEQGEWVRRSVDGESPQLRLSLAGQGKLLAFAGAEEIGIPQMEHVYTSMSDQPGMEAWLRIVATDISDVYIQQRNFAEALRWVRIQVADDVSQVGADNPDLFWDHVDRTRAAAHVGELAEAEASLNAARAVAEHFSDSDQLGLHLAAGELAVAKGQFEQAAAPLELVRDRLHPEEGDPRTQAQRADACDGLVTVYAERGDGVRSEQMRACRDEANRRAGPLRAAPEPS